MVSKADPPTGTIRIMNAAGVPSEVIIQNFIYTKNIFTIRMIAED